MNPSRQDASKGDILIIDDDLSRIATLSSMLIKEGYAVRSAPNGKEGLIVIENKPPELILIDIKWLEMDALNICWKIKATDKSSKIPILILSDRDDAKDKIKVFEAGAVDLHKQTVSERRGVGPR